jgi:hypothetical protein
MKGLFIGLIALSLTSWMAAPGCSATVGDASARQEEARDQQEGDGPGTGSNPEAVDVRPYTRDDGTPVEGHRRSAPNDTELDNWGTKGNVNPDTNEPGTRTPDEED